MQKIRLQKFLADAGLMSRRAAEEEIRNGKVSVNGHVAELGAKINPNAATRHRNPKEPRTQNQKPFFRKCPPSMPIENPYSI